MTSINYGAMSLDELRQYVLTHREDIDAFQLYVDRSKTTGRMISIDPSDVYWETNLDNQIQQISSNDVESN
jgi:hypothetical protein